MNQCSDVQRIKLEPAQACKAPFPPGCAVLVLRNSRISCSGEVISVYVSFEHNSGSCNNCYEVLTDNSNGMKVASVVSGELLRYDMDCPIYITPPNCSGSLNEIDMLEGVIKGFEMQAEDEVTTHTSGLPTFLYTVEVSATDGDNQESLFRQRGIEQEHIRYRKNTIKNYKGNYPQDLKSSTVSFDDTTASNSKEDSRQSFFSFDEKKHPGHPSLLKPIDQNICPPPHAAAQVLCGINSGGHPFRSQIQVTQDLSISVSPSNNSKRNCSLHSSPVPARFQGNMLKYMNETVPEFNFLSNFPVPTPTTKSCFGKKCCVMCGEWRWDGKTTNGSVWIPNQNKGLCTICDVNVWIVNKTKMQIKWCKGCKNFQTWASFGEKGSATKCNPCRTRQREKYAMTKKRKAGEISKLVEGIQIELEKQAS